MLQISRKIIFGLIEIQSLNNIVLAYVNRVFESLKKKINVFKELIISAFPGFTSELQSQFEKAEIVEYLENFI